jgi:pantetheine-phosphate adenylyltransferase
MTQEKTGSKVAIYPGSFDPITNGHVDIIKRGSRIFDKIIILVAYNPRKSFLFSVEERCQFIREIFKDCEYIQVDSHDGLLIDYLHSSGASTILRGMRALSDFEYEFQMALMNRRQTKNVETVFLMSGFRWFFTSSNIIKEVASLGGTVRGLVPENVHQKLLEKYPMKNNRR